MRMHLNRAERIAAGILGAMFWIGLLGIQDLGLWGLGLVGLSVVCTLVWMLVIKVQEINSPPLLKMSRRQSYPNYPSWWPNRWK